MLQGLSRREALASLSAAVAAKLPGATVEAAEAKRPLMIRVRVPFAPQPWQRVAIERAVGEKLDGTELAGLPVFVLAPGVDIELVEEPGT